jgi:glycosyltransferase involved in cell wall biosynthesis
LNIPFSAEREQLVVFFGTWSKRKAPERIVRVMTEVLNRDQSCRFEVMGAGGAEQEVMGAFPVEVRNRVKVHGTLPTRDVAATLQRAKVMFFPSRYEGFGMATSESMACGCAVVVTPTGFGADLRDEVD